MPPKTVRDLIPHIESRVVANQYDRDIMTAYTRINPNFRDNAEVCAASRPLLLVKSGHIVVTLR